MTSKLTNRLKKLQKFNLIINFDIRFDKKHI